MRSPYGGLTVNTTWFIIPHVDTICDIVHDWFGVRILNDCCEVRWSGFCWVFEEW